MLRRFRLAERSDSRMEYGLLQHFVHRFPGRRCQPDRCCIAAQVQLAASRRSRQSQEYFQQQLPLGKGDPRTGQRTPMARSYLESRCRFLRSQFWQDLNTRSHPQVSEQARHNRSRAIEIGPLQFHRPNARCGRHRWSGRPDQRALEQHSRRNGRRF